MKIKIAKKANIHKLIRPTADAGFSLIEVLVGTVIIISATTVVLSIIISSFRISSKTTANSVIRQNGNYALSQATRMIQFADSFDKITCGVDSYYDCRELRDNNCTRVDIHYDGLPRFINCSTGTTGTGLSIDGESSIDTNKFLVTECEFKCSQNLDEGPTIGIDFSITTRGEVPVEQKSGIDFSTKVKMRNN